MENNQCPLCQSSEPSQLIWENQDMRIIFANEALFPGFVRVIWKKHIAEMTQLSSADRNTLMEMVYLVEAVVREVMQPKKINLAALGNMVPHIHWHVIPRYEDDATFPGSVWSEKLRQTQQSVLDELLAREVILKKALQDKLKAIA